MQAAGVLVIAIAFAAVGYLTGWLVGGSTTPVIAALLPLVFGLLTGIGVSYVDAAAKLKAVRELLARDPSPSIDELRAAAEDRRSSLVAAGGVAVIVFCAACYVGVKHGIDLRVPEYPSVTQAVGNIGSPRFDEIAEVHRLRRGMLVRNMPRADFDDVIRGVVIPLFQDPEYAPGGELGDFRRSQLSQLVDKIIGPDVSSGRGRGPASEESEPDR